ncbi:MAG: hypothetical protein K2G69_08720 [Muribaculaceae bacterium]|nr:hypothetical protein [Muribaculaceae bacterium]
MNEEILTLGGAEQVMRLTEYLTKIGCQPSLAPDKALIWVNYKNISFIIRFTEQYIQIEAILLATLSLGKTPHRERFCEVISYLSHYPGPRMAISRQNGDNDLPVAAYYELYSPFCGGEESEQENILALIRILDSFLNLRVELLLEAEIFKNQISKMN